MFQDLIANTQLTYYLQQVLRVCSLNPKMSLERMDYIFSLLLGLPQPSRASFAAHPLAVARYSCENDRSKSTPRSFTAVSRSNDIFGLN